MPKSGRGRGKSFRAKKTQARRSAPAPVAQKTPGTPSQPAAPVAQAAPLRKSSASVDASGLRGKTVMLAHVHIGAELRKIAILSAIMIIVLVVLYLVLP